MQPKPRDVDLDSGKRLEHRRGLWRQADLLTRFAQGGVHERCIGRIELPSREGDLPAVRAAFGSAQQDDTQVTCRVPIDGHECRRVDKFAPVSHRGPRHCGRGVQPAVGLFMGNLLLRVRGDECGVAHSLTGRNPVAKSRTCEKPAAGFRRRCSVGSVPCRLAPRFPCWKFANWSRFIRAPWPRSRASSSTRTSTCCSSGATKRRCGCKETSAPQPDGDTVAARRAGCDQRVCARASHHR